MIGQYYKINIKKLDLTRVFYFDVFLMKVFYNIIIGSVLS